MLKKASQGTMFCFSSWNAINIWYIYEDMFCYLHCMTKDVLCSVTSLSAVLIEWVQAAHLQGQDDPDHQVWNQGYKSKYVVTKNETDCGGIKNCDIISISCVEHFIYKSSPQLLCNTIYVKISGPNMFKGTCPFTFLEWKKTAYKMCNWYWFKKNNSTKVSLFQTQTHFINAK